MELLYHILTKMSSNIFTNLFGVPKRNRTSTFFSGIVDFKSTASTSSATGTYIIGGSARIWT